MSDITASRPEVVNGHIRDNYQPSESDGKKLT